jgi:HSP20 family protein
MDLLRAVLAQDSLRELERVANQINRIRQTTSSGASQEAMAEADWVPRVDVAESETEFVLLAELAGVDRDDVKLTAEKGVLTLSGNRNHDEGKGLRYHRVERPSGRFARTFTLPDAVDEDKLSAEYRNGILTVHLPKSEKAKPRSIDVQVR